MNPPLDMSDGICAYLQGGMGNQLFIVAAAWEQADRLGCPLYIDGSRFLAADPIEFAKETPRHFDLGTLALPGTVVAENSPWFKNSPRRPRVIRRPARASHRLAVYRQPSFGFDPAVNDVTVGTTLLGYFQSPKYFPTVADRVNQMIWDAPVTDVDQMELDRIREHPRLTVHMRRGDYLDAATRAHHGVASAEYFTRALQLCDRLVPGTEALVFSDSPDVAAEELGSRPGVTFFDGLETMGTLTTLKAMALGHGFIMSNSSFSWWAAWMMSRLSDGPVIGPRPWEASGESANDLLLAHWMTLDARA
ncbi:alpha-1,2-fucosyltransferase [Cryobacterium frigoriphilum]|uniref:Alpha-1,2-fucosyltransferase n=1 Tax=Cryobacterium frigoriphilum TaxID=1259150 RepID=A0A4R9A2K0_9MICO|nr:alpha-1,2-fucosyltransferase [Cryobacterium frigoriphilum]TFD50808.1 alpha-1,2-fucosyltransferase [Cryobacterium frigoriphilum]